MTTIDELSAAAISMIIADVDGTLVTTNKTLTPRAQAAAAALHAAGIVFAIISSRPPRGLRMLVEPLALTTPLAGFNGGTLVMPDFTVIEEHLIAPQIARRAVDAITEHGAQAWVFSGREWLVRETEGAYVAHEEHTVQFPPTVVGDFGSSLDGAAKIVGVSADFALLARCESATQSLLGEDASVARSQLYYLDVTHPLANKGAGVRALARHVNIPLREIATIGDGLNDIPMFAESGISIAMGNASPEVQARAQFVTGSNEEDGFAAAIEQILLTRSPSRAGRS
ncbi:MAG TPA: Cof-type HAD-IIB family hydrolase [Stellaceae bacterium]|nr:Cof-type HAD-IIB family hydrolase [Stellaceae bacterium]